MRPNKCAISIANETIGGAKRFFAFLVLPASSKTLAFFTLNQSISGPGGVLWDGKHLAVADAFSSMMYEFTTSGDEGTEFGSTSLNGVTTIGQFWIQDKQVIVPLPLRVDAQRRILALPCRRYTQQVSDGVHLPGRRDV
jgi:hypothetical protein